MTSYLYRAENGPNFVGRSYSSLEELYATACLDPNVTDNKIYLREINTYRVLSRNITLDELHREVCQAIRSKDESI